MKKVLVICFLALLLINCNTNQNNNQFKGNWYYCSEGKYYELHILKKYLEICNEHIKTGMECGYKFEGKIIIISRDVNFKQIMLTAKLEFVDDNRCNMCILNEEKDTIFLYKLSDTILLFDNLIKDSDSLRNEKRMKYIQEYNKREKRFKCN